MDHVQKNRIKQNDRKTTIVVQRVAHTAGCTQKSTLKKT